MKKAAKIARRFVVRGRVQGVGFRYFVRNAANRLALTGVVRNRDDGDVEVIVVGEPGAISEFNGLLYTGPHLAEVRGVEEQEAPLQQYSSFEISP